VAVTAEAGLEPALGAVRTTVAGFDAACSSFRDDSELARLNDAAGMPVVVGALLFDAVRTAMRVAALTDGVVDPTVGGALADYGFVPASAAKSRATGDWRAIKLHAPARVVQLEPGVRLDLGATAKALAADTAAAAAQRAAGCGVLVSLAGDVAVQGPAPEGGWRIRVVDDHRHGEAPGQTVSIQGGGLATSGTAARTRSQGGELVSHLIDPRSGRPAASPWRTASVAARSCLEANALSTATVVIGSRGRVWLAQSSVPARLVSVDGNVMRTGDWPAEGDDLCP
jgi:thiamine biosynthesis lipoprotein